MNLTKTTFGAFALTTTILLGACGNNDMHKDDKMDTKTEMKDKDMSKENMKDMIMSGMFESMNGEKVEGKAMIKDSKLMLTDFKSSKGPDLHVYLTKDGDVKKGMKIDKVDYDKVEQTFDLKDMDTSKYNEVTIQNDELRVLV
ncbi:DM13 domain-containing protein [Mammaliicoccus sciuri]|uniref:DM13 domain-containing protein n=1 Tax=Mammaliicoccus sciuri TaxID=1296 RepID=UPI0019509E9D|nr:DM13 domain-containing protein [Mammaliicoccus sciuri]MEB7409823.1 DM13 domain-containing protein [Mammaliicoccus sciuri]MEB8131409.1 DM13 domain-containing protein [Mammaliicoccus sciuri]